MKVALINPPDCGTGSDRAPEPLGLGYLASILETSGRHTCDLYDLAEHDPLEIDDLIPADYDLYGITTYTKSWLGAKSVIRAIRAATPDARIVLGGPHASTCAAEVLADSDADFVIRNDGELPLLALADALAQGLPLADVPNLSWIAQGTMRHNDPLTKLPHLDELPWPKRTYRVHPLRDDLEPRRHVKPVPVVFLCSSRGCPKRCSFCSIVVMSPKYRYRSVESIMLEIESLRAQHSFGHIAFHDANFFVLAERTLAFAKALHSFDPEMTWSGTATADRIIRHADVLEEIGRLNCAYLEVGIESGSPSALARYNKWTTVEQNEAAVRMLMTHGIELNLDFIMFDPESTLENLRENFAFLFRTGLVGHYPPDCLDNALKLYPGTQARKVYVERFGLVEAHDMKLLPPFVHQDVEWVYRCMSWFGRHRRPAIDQCIEDLDTGAPEQVRARRLALQHAPYAFFQIVLERAEDGGALPDPSEDSLKGIGALTACDNALRGIELKLEVAKSPQFDVLAGPGIVWTEHHMSVYLIPPGRPMQRLSHSASELWRLLDHGFTRSEIESRYAVAFNCELSEAAADLDRFTAEMSKIGVLRPRPKGTLIVG